MDNRYFIKESYLINGETITADHISGECYWTKKRLRDASSFQFPVYEFVSNFIKNNNLRSLVDIGCGVGVKLEYIKSINPSLQIYGIDQKQAIELCKEKYDFGVWVADDFEKSVQSKIADSPDVILCADVIEHLQDPDLLLQYILNLSDVGTTIIISTPERDSMRGKSALSSPNLYHVREWNFEEFKKYIQFNGFKILDHFCLPPYRLDLSLSVLRDELSRRLKNLPFNNNQVVVLKKS